MARSATAYISAGIIDHTPDLVICLCSHVCLLSNSCFLTSDCECYRFILSSMRSVRRVNEAQWVYLCRYSARCLPGAIIGHLSWKYLTKYSSIVHVSLKKNASRSPYFISSSSEEMNLYPIPFILLGIFA